jgi:hypothetical protein
MDNTLSYYKPSGRIGPVFLVVLPAALAVIVLLAVVYQFLVTVIPLVWLGLGVFLVTGLGCNAIAKRAVLWGKCRSPFFGTHVGLAAAVVFILAGHASSFLFYRGVARHHGKDLTVTRYLEIREEVGWTFRRARNRDSLLPDRERTVHLGGKLVYVAWTLELLLAVSFIAAGTRRTAKTPFCEACGRWLIHERILRNYRTDRKGVTALREARSVETLADWFLPDYSPKATVVYRYRQCPKCSDERFLTVRILRAPAPVHDWFRITREEFASIQAVERPKGRSPSPPGRFERLKRRWKRVRRREREWEERERDLERKTRDRYR